MILTRSSQIARSENIIIDNFNADIDSVCLLQRVQFEPIYRVFSRPVSEVAVFDEKYFSDIESAVSYWSHLMSYKRALF